MPCDLVAGGDEDTAGTHGRKFPLRYYRWNNTERAVKQLLSGGVRTSFLTVVVCNRPVPFMEELLFVTAGELKDSEV